MRSGTAHGYIDDAVYPTTYFRELSPVWLNYVAAIRGATPRKLDGAFTYLELGCGHAYSTLVHAAAFPAARFYACDFNAACITAAQERAHALAIRNITFHQTSFDELFGADLPSFDFIVLHGVYSWVDSDVRESLRRLIRARLKPGGLVYLSYNCLPGWSIEAPLRKLLIELATSADGDPEQRATHAVHELAQLGGAGLRYFQTNPGVRAAIDAYARSPSGYLAHEFLNEAWEPQYSIDVADEMAEAGVTYLGSATLANNYDALTIDAAAAQAIAQLTTPRQQQLATDFAVNRQFRRDVFIRAMDVHAAVDSAEILGNVVIGCLSPPEMIDTTAQVPRGTITFHQEFIAKLRTVVTRGSMPLRELGWALAGAGAVDVEIMRNLLYLIAAGVLTPFAAAHRATSAPRATEFASETVARMFRDVAAGDGPGQIASEVVGSGVVLQPFEAQMVIDAAGRKANDSLKVLPDLVARLRRLGLLR
jgi:SAM-dependent methyltransferase